jgi:hypothetical protein
VSLFINERVPSKETHLPVEELSERTGVWLLRPVPGNSYMIVLNSPVNTQASLLVRKVDENDVIQNISLGQPTSVSANGGLYYFAKITPPIGSREAFLRIMSDVGPLQAYYDSDPFPSPGSTALHTEIDTQIRQIIPLDQNTDYYITISNKNQTAFMFLVEAYSVKVLYIDTEFP